MNQRIFEAMLCQHPGCGHGKLKFRHEACRGTRLSFNRAKEFIVASRLRDAEHLRDILSLGHSPLDDCLLTHEQVEELMSL